MSARQKQKRRDSTRNDSRFAFIFLGILVLIILGLVLFIKPRQPRKKSIHSHDSSVDDRNVQSIINNDTIESNIVKSRDLDETTVPLSCPIGSTYYPEFNECIRNIFWPDPVDTSLQDIRVAPCTDFYQYSCGAFNDDPQNIGQDATFKHLYQSNQKIVKDIIRTVVDSDEESKISIFYTSCMKEDIKSLSTDSVMIEKSLFSLVDTHLKSISDISYVMGMLQKYDTVLPLELSFELDPKNADLFVPLLKQGGVFASLNADVYTTEHLISVYQRFQKYTHDKDAMNMAKSVVEIEQNLVKHFSDTSARNIIEYIPIYESSDRVIDWRKYFYASSQDVFNLTAFFMGARPSSITPADWIDSLYQSHLWCHTPLYIKQMSEIIRSHSIASWKHYFKHALIFHLVDDGAPHIDPGSHYAFHREYDSQHSLPWRRMRRFLAIKDMTDSDISREEECIFHTQAYLPVILDDYFVHSELDVHSRAAALEVVEHVRNTFMDLIPRLNIFKSQQYKVVEYAINKINHTTIHVGTPDAWPVDRSELVLTPTSFYDNIIRIRQYHMNQNYMLFYRHIQSRQRVDSGELFDGLLTVANSVFQHQLNTITLNAGLLRPPIFSRLYDDIAKFARLGYLVAHELAHAIDENGSQFSHTGAVEHWYTIDPSIKSCLVSLYSVPTPNGNAQDGKRTLQENFADTLGFLVSYQAFVSYQSLMGKAPTFDQQQEFYLAFAQLYCESLSPEEELRVLNSFTHSLGSIRVNSIISQNPEFNSIWHCPRSVVPFSSCIYIYL